MGQFQEKVEEMKERIQELSYSPPEATEEILKNTDNPQNNIDNNENVTDTEINPNLTQTNHKKNKNFTLKKRIDHLVYENKIKDTQTQKLLNALQETKQRLAEQDILLKQKEAYINDYYENNLQNKKMAVKEAIKMAKEEGDIDKESDLLQESQQITAELAAHNLYKHKILPKELEEQASLYNQHYYQDDFSTNNNKNVEPQAEHNEELDIWLERNPWADPHSQMFDQDLRNEVNEIASELDKRLKFNGSAHLIGTAEYFNSLDNIMKDRWGYQASTKNREDEDDQEDLYSNTSSPTYYQSPVSPVTRNGSFMSEQYVQQHAQKSNHPQIALSPQELALARNLHIKTQNGYANPSQALQTFQYYKNLYKNKPTTKITIE